MSTKPAPPEAPKEKPAGPEKPKDGSAAPAQNVDDHAEDTHEQVKSTMSAKRRRGSFMFKDRSDDYERPWLLKHPKWWNPATETNSIMATTRNALATGLVFANPVVGLGAYAAYKGGSKALELGKKYIPPVRWADTLTRNVVGTAATGGKSLLRMVAAPFINTGILAVRAAQTAVTPFHYVWDRLGPDMWNDTLRYLKTGKMDAETSTPAMLAIKTGKLVKNILGFGVNHIKRLLGAPVWTKGPDGKHHVISGLGVWAASWLGTGLAYTAVTNPVALIPVGETLLKFLVDLPTKIVEFMGGAANAINKVIPW